MQHAFEFYITVMYQYHKTYMPLKPKTYMPLKPKTNNISIFNMQHSNRKIILQNSNQKSIFNLL